MPERNGSNVILLEALLVKPVQRERKNGRRFAASPL